MKNKILKIFYLLTFIVLFMNVKTFAAQLDPTIATFSSASLSLSSDGTARFTPPAYSGHWKKFEVQLLKRVSTMQGNVTTYSYKTSGSVRSVDPSDNEYTFNISSTGYYQFQIRGVNLEGNYAAWSMIVGPASWSTYEGVPVTEDDISAGGSSSSGTGIGSGTNYNYGPGVAQYGYYPYGMQQYVYGPNGEILYNYGQQYGNYNQNGMNGYVGAPGNYNYNNQGNNTFYPNTGISNYPQVPAPNIGGLNGNYNGGNYNYNNGNYNNGNYGNTNGQTNPNYYTGVGSNNPNNYGYQGNGASPQITQGLEIGWHVDNNGRFYYQGNGVVLRGTWYNIDGSFYRFADTGYVLANQWFKDPTTSYWYYLAADGKMLTGWQKINNAWYYFKPINGNGYGAMYSNTQATITDAAWGTGVYAFDTNGVCIMNAWYGGFYYGSDGKRRN